MLAHYLRRWSNIKATLAHFFMFAGVSYFQISPCLNANEAVCTCTCTHHTDVCVRMYCILTTHCFTLHYISSGKSRRIIIQFYSQECSLAFSSLTLRTLLFRIRSAANTLSPMSGSSIFSVWLQLKCWLVRLVSFCVCLASGFLSVTAPGKTYVYLAGVRTL